jgi:hypothetical protein
MHERPLAKARPAQAALCGDSRARRRGLHLLDRNAALVSPPENLLLAITLSVAVFASAAVNCVFFSPNWQLWIDEVFTYFFLADPRFDHMWLDVTADM